MSKTDMFTIGPVTLAFPSLFEPSAPRGSDAEPKYNTAIVISQAIYEAQIKPLLDQMVAADFQKGEAAHPSFKWGFLPCTAKPATYPPELTAGMYYCNAKSKFTIDIIGADRMPIMEPNTIKDGAQVYIQISLYTFNQMGNGIGVGLGPIMYAGQGTALNVTSAVSAKDAFAGVTIDPSIAPPVPAIAAAPAVPVAPAMVAPVAAVPAVPTIPVAPIIS